MSAQPAEARLNWGSGTAGQPGWINADIRDGPGVDIACDILDGLPLENASIEYAVSVHALQEIPLDKLVPVLSELRRVLVGGGALRLVLPDLMKGVDAYRRGDAAYFLVPDEDARTIGAKFVTHVLWYGYSRTVFVYDFVEELLLRAGFSAVHEVAFRETTTGRDGILELDNREAESLFVEAIA